MSCHVKMAFGTSIIWFFLSQLSQYTLYGRNGSNACTFITLLLAKFYFLHKSALSLRKYRIYSLIRRTIFYEKICLFDENLLKTRGAPYNRVFSRNDCVIQTTRPS